MAVDFYHKYRGWTDEALRAVLQNPERYRPEARMAAEALLKERSDSAGLAGPIPATGLFDDGGLPETNLLADLSGRRLLGPFTPWIISICLLVAASYAWYFFRLFGSFKAAGLDWQLLFLAPAYFFLPVARVVALVLFLRRKSLGWILIAADLTFSTGMDLFQLLLQRTGAESYPGVRDVQLVTAIAEAALHGLVLAGMLWPGFPDRWNVSREARWISPVAGLALPAFYLLIVYSLFSR